VYSLPSLWKSLPVIALATIAQTGLADHHKPLSISRVVQIVTEKGYADITDIELSRNDNEYEVTAHTRKGEEVEIELNAYAGRLKSIER